MGSSIVMMWQRRAWLILDRGGQRGRLSAAGHSGNDHQPLPLRRDPAHRLDLEVEVLERGDLGVDPPDRQRDRAALPEGVDPVAADLGDRVGEVEVGAPLERDALLGRQDREEHLLDRRRVEALGVEVADLALDPQDRRVADLEVQVRRGTCSSAGAAAPGPSARLRCRRGSGGSGGSRSARSSGPSWTPQG